jgi:hypothetical protein
MAGRSGLSKSTVGRIWRKFDLEPHLIDGFKPSTDQSSQPGPAPSSWLQAARPGHADLRSQRQHLPNEDPGARSFSAERRGAMLQVSLAN